MKIIPTGDRILVQRDEADDKTQGGIIIPDNAKEVPVRGKVLAVGPGRILDNGKRLEPMLQAGDEVIFGKYAGTAIGDQRERKTILREDDIMAVIEKT